ncbi:MAG: glycosyltransferase, partial [Nitrospinota bacterium]
PIAKKLNIPLLVSFHGYDASRLLANKKYVKSLRRLFEYSYIISVSKIMTDRLVAIGANPSKIKLLYYSIPKDAFTYTARTPLLEKMKSGAKIHFLQVSNFVEKKGHRYTVEAFCRFLKKYSRGRLILAGDGPERPKIEALCKELNIAGKVSFLGRVVESQVIELMKSVDVFLHHSVIDSQGEEEGIPNVIMEAMATGLPIVSTFHAGIPELVRNEVDGLLVRERDVDQYAQKLIEVVESDKRYGENGAARIRSHFNVDVQNEVLADHYREIIEG